MASRRSSRKRVLAKAGLAAAVLGAAIKLAAITALLPQPADSLGDILIFFAALAIALDICRG
jgi:hypothetical protein